MDPYLAHGDVNMSRRIRTLTIVTFQAAIWHCLNHYDFGDATFLAERLFAEGNQSYTRWKKETELINDTSTTFSVRTEDSLHLLATCYYRSGKLNEAYEVLKEEWNKTPKNKFLLAKCCADLNK